MRPRTASALIPRTSAASATVVRRMCGVRSSPTPPYYRSLRGPLLALRSDPRASEDESEVASGGDGLRGVLQDPVYLSVEDLRQVPYLVRVLCVLGQRLDAQARLAQGYGGPLLCSLFVVHSSLPSSRLRGTTPPRRVPSARISRAIAERVAWSATCRLMELRITAIIAMTSSAGTISSLIRATLTSASTVLCLREIHLSRSRHTASLSASLPAAPSDSPICASKSAIFVSASAISSRRSWRSVSASAVS